MKELLSIYRVQQKSNPCNFSLQAIKAAGESLTGLSMKS